MKFKYFVILAEMRTGSNLLESNLNSFDDILCHGEAFNPQFMGYPENDSILGIDAVERNQNPEALVKAVKSAPGMNGFRYFHNHEPRVLDKILRDKSCAKIVLNRNPIDSYVSLKIARVTGQWKLTNPNAIKRSTIEFDRDEFEAHLQDAQDFQIKILSRLQKTGQSAFYISYEDLQDVDVLNGLGQWLGVDQVLESANSNLKPQNPQPISEKVENHKAMEKSLARLDRFNLARTPNFEPRRGPVVPSYIAAARSPLLYQGIQGGPTDMIASWLARLDGVTEEDLRRGLTQAELKKWQRSHATHYSFSVLRHPLARAHACFCEKILPNDGSGYLVIRQKLTKFYGVNLPDADGDTYDHRHAFEAFLDFLERNLNGQTSVRVDPWWISQSAVLEGFSKLRVPDILVREQCLAEGLAMLSLQLRVSDVPDLPDVIDPYGHKLAEIYDQSLEAKARKIYQRDFLSFGFDRWGIA